MIHLTGSIYAVERPMKNGIPDNCELLGVIQNGEIPEELESVAKSIYYPINDGSYEYDGCNAIEAMKDDLHWLKVDFSKTIVIIKKNE